MSRHALRRDPRGHWLLLVLFLPVVTAALVFQGWTSHEVDEARTKAPCETPMPREADNGDPVLRIDKGKVETASMPARTAAITFNGGPDPRWTPRILDMLRERKAKATFFVYGAQAASHPEIMRRIRAEGHEIGSYTYTGGDMGVASPVRAQLELSLTQTALAGTAGVNTACCACRTPRPPTRSAARSGRRPNAAPPGAT